MTTRRKRDQASQSEESQPIDPNDNDLNLNLNSSSNRTSDTKQSGKSSDTARIVTAAIGIPIVLFLVWYGSWPFYAVVALLALVGLRELDLAHRKACTPLVGVIAYPALLAVLGLAMQFARIGELAQASAPALFFSLWIVPVALLTLGVLAFTARGKISLNSIALTNFAILYVGLFAFLILLRGFPRGGLHLFWIVLFGVWVGDSFAYFGGRKWGKTPLTPLSPKKTLEGILIGAALSVVVCAALSVWFGFGLLHGLVLGVLIALAAPLGDLAESFWKRELDIKDMGALLPGHGGVLDRCDSLLFATFVVYLYELWRA